MLSIYQADVRCKLDNRERQRRLGQDACDQGVAGHGARMSLTKEREGHGNCAKNRQRQDFYGGLIAKVKAGAYRQEAFWILLGFAAKMLRSRRAKHITTDYERLEVN